MANNNELKILITGDASSAMGVLNSFSQSVKGATSEVSNHFASVGNVIESMAAPLMKITALIGGGALFKGAIGDAVTFSKEVGSLQRVMGGTTKEATALTLAIGDVYGDVETYEGAASKLVKTLNTNESAIKGLGVTTRNSKGEFRDMGSLLPEVVASLDQFATGTDRDAAAQSIFGRSFRDVLKYAAMTPEVMEEARKKAEGLGLELSTQERGVLKAYRAAVNDAEDTLLGLQNRVALGVMPSLTSLSNWFSSTGPGAIQGLTGLLRGTGEVLSTTSAKVAIAGIALNSLLPVFGALALRIPLVSMAVGTFNVQMALAAREGVTGLAAIGGAAKGTTLSLLGMINPVTVFAAAVLGGFFVAERWATSASKAADVQLDLSRKTLATGQSFKDLSEKAEGYDRTIRSTKSTDDEKRKAQGHLKIVLDQLNEAYPGFNRYLVDEAGHHRSIAEALKVANAERTKELRLKLALAQTALTHASLDAGYAEKDRDANWFTRNSGIMKTRAADAKVAVEKLQETVNTYRNALLSMDAVDEPGKKHWKGGDGNPKANSHAENMVRLRKQGLESAQKTTLEEERLAEVMKLDLQREGDLLDIKAKVTKGEITEAQAKDERQVVEANYANARMGVWDAFAVKRKAMEVDLQAKVTALEEGGLDKRLEAVRRAFDAVRAENAKLALDGKKYLNDEEIKAAEDAATAQAKKDQIQADLTKLKKELSELAQVSGGKLSEGDKKEVLDRWKGQGGTKADAAGIYEKESHVGEGGGAGIKAGISGYLAQAKNSFEAWKGFATNVLGSTENAFSNFFTSLTQQGSTFGQKTKALWQGITSSVVGGLSKIAAQHLITWGIEKAKLAWDAIRAAWNTADTTKTVTENATKSASNTGTAATGFFASFASTGPWGYALAAAAIVAMFALLGSITGRKVGGVVGKNGPEMTMLGEEGLEVVAPEHDFKHWAANLKTAGADMGYNLGRHEAQISALNSKAGSYATHALAQGGGQIPSNYADYRGSTIITTDSRQWAEMVNQGQKTFGRANG